MAPTCSPNGLGNATALCDTAVTSCPDGLVRFWVWHRTTTWTKDVDGTVTSDVGPWTQEQGSFCLGADDPGVPTIAQGPRPRPQPVHLASRCGCRPRGPTLRRRRWSTPRPRSPPAARSRRASTRCCSALSVHVTAKPVRWHWTWGDGTSEDVDRPGTPRQPDVTHTYERAGDVRATVVVEWRGTFSVGNDPTQYAIQTPAFVRSAPITVRVREARSQLVR